MNVSKLSPNLLTTSSSKDIGVLGIGLIHEIASPLSAALIQIDLLRSNIKSMESSIRIMQNYLAMPTTIRTFNIRQAIKASLIDLSNRHPDALFDLILDEEISLRGDKLKFCVIISNLVLNAIESYDFNNNRYVKITVSGQSSGINISIEDSGKGFIPIRQNTKSSTLKHGLGLSIVQLLLQNDFSGTIQITRNNPRGTIFSCNLYSQQ